MRHDDPHHSEVQVAEHLRREFPRGVSIQVFENRREDEAFNTILRTLDANRGGKLSAGEKQRARIILYGHSWGGCAVVTLARRLARDDVPVLLTIQVDSVAKFWQDDRVLPANVERAVNFYQTHGIIHGAPKITAADPSRTQILGNFRLDYGTRPIACYGYPWYDNVFYRAHTEIECDPRVWSQVEMLIRSEILSSEPNLASTAVPR